MRPPEATDQPGPGPEAEAAGDPVDGRRTVIGGLTHSLGNLFSSALLAAPLLRADPASERASSLLSSLETAMERGIELVEEIKLYLRYESSDGAVDLRLKNLVEGVAKVARDRAGDRCVFETSYAPDLPLVTIEPLLLFDLLLALTAHVMNGVAPGSRITIAVASTGEVQRPDDAASEGVAEITLLYDTHALIENEARSNERLEGRVEEISRQTSCRVVRVQTSKRSGWKVVLQETPSPDEGSISESPPVAKGGDGQLILLVDDDETFATMASSTLREHGYRVLIANSGIEAIQVYRQRGLDIDLVVTDLAMTGMTGLNSIQRLKQLNPDVSIVVVTGVVALERRARQLSGVVKQVVRKPLGQDELLRAVEVGLRETRRR